MRTTARTTLPAPCALTRTSMHTSTRAAAVLLAVCALGLGAPLRGVQAAPITTAPQPGAGLVRRRAQACVDKAASGLTRNGMTLACTDPSIAGLCANLDLVKTNCPKTCAACTNGAGAAMCVDKSVTELAAEGVTTSCAAILARGGCTTAGYKEWCCATCAAGPLGSLAPTASPTPTEPYHTTKGVCGDRDGSGPGQSAVTNADCGAGYRTKINTAHVTCAAMLCAPSTTAYDREQCCCVTADCPRVPAPVSVQFYFDAKAESEPEHPVYRAMLGCLFGVLLGVAAWRLSEDWRFGVAAAVPAILLGLLIGLGGWWVFFGVLLVLFSCVWFWHHSPQGTALWSNVVSQKPLVVRVMASDGMQQTQRKLLNAKHQPEEQEAARAAAAGKVLEAKWKKSEMHRKVEPEPEAKPLKPNPYQAPAYLQDKWDSAPPAKKSGPPVPAPPAKKSGPPVPAPPAKKAGPSVPAAPAKRVGPPVPKRAGPPLPVKKAKATAPVPVPSPVAAVSASPATGPCR